MAHTQICPKLVTRIREMAMSGLSNKEITKRLGCCYRTIARYTGDIQRPTFTKPKIAP